MTRPMQSFGPMKSFGPLQYLGLVNGPGPYAA